MFEGTEKDTNNTAVKELTDANFTQAVATGLSLVDFWAPWCGPCRMQGPVLEEVAGQMGDKAGVYKINVDDNPDTAMVYKVMSIPTLLIFKDGELQRQMVGLQQAVNLVAELTALQ